jgi:hypothetical protein
MCREERVFRRPAALLLTAMAAIGALLAPVPAGAVPVAPADVVLRPITVPVQGSFSYTDDFGDPRPGGRTHQGNDLMAPKLRPLLAANAGKVSYLKVADGGSGGNMLAIKDADGWSYWYMHINNDTPGTDDGANPLEYAFAPGITVGANVTAGQVVAFVGDSGDAERTSPHLHFEIHQPDGKVVDPWPSLRVAQGFRVGNYCAFDTNPKRTPSAASGPGYWTVAADGGVYSFGAAAFWGSTGDRRLNRPVVGMASTPGGTGYWLAATDGGIFAFGDANFYGSTGGIQLNQPITGMAATPSGKGYWLVARDGGIFAFGDANFYGSTGGIQLNQPITGMAATPSGKGYWLVAADGGIFAFGDANFYGSTGGLRLNQPVVALASSPGGRGYWLLAGDGGVFAFGDAGSYGSLPATGLCSLPKAAGILGSATGKGYWVATADGAVWPFGDASDYGSLVTLGLSARSGVFALAGVRPRLPVVPVVPVLPDVPVVPVVPVVPRGPHPRG